MAANRIIKSVIYHISINSEPNLMILVSIF